MVALVSCKPYTTLELNNFDYLYDPQMPLEVQNKVVFSSDNTAEVFFSVKAHKISPEQPANFLKKRYKLNWEIVHRYDVKLGLYADSLTNLKMVYDAEGNIRFSLKVKLANTSLPLIKGVLTFTERVTDRQAVFVVDLEPLKVGLGQKYVMTDAKTGLPFLGNFITTSDTFVISPTNKTMGKSTLVFKHYPEAFAPAAPANAVNVPAPKLLKPAAIFTDSSFKSINFTAPGLYFVQEDTASRDGYAFLVEPFKYPKLSQSIELITPLIYITTREEREKLYKADRTKDMLDKFWLEVAGNKEQARALIRSYYGNIELSNRLFSTYKEGWRTDMGMILTVLGKPDKVYKSAQSEEWIYDNNVLQQSISFVFVLRPTIFNPFNYELVRSADYSRIWYATVDQWRRGINQK